MCGSTGTSTSTNTTLPTAAAQANYDKLSSLAWNTYNQPYQQYTGEMVAGLSPTEQTGIQNINAAAGLAQPYFAQATTDINQGQSYALPKIDAAYNQVGLGQQLGSQYNQNATNTLNAAYSELTPQVRQQESAVNAALGQGQNYLTQATNLAGNAAAPVYAQQFSQDALSQYMNPYMNQVIQGTLAPLRQQQQMEQQGLIGNQITQGAFGGERADLARAALQGQQDIATGNVLGNLLNTGYAQGLGAFQQQQGVNLGAGQANRAALANQANQIAALGQQGFGQGLSAAQEEAALAGQNFGAGSQTAQQLANIGQQAFSQDVGAAQAQAGLAGQAFGIDQATSQQLASLGTGAQSAALQGAQAQMSSGAVQRGIQQANDVANQQQFQAAQAFPYQNEQLLANLLLGIGGQSGGTALTSQPTGNMLSSIIGGTLALGQTGLLGSDERFKENMEPVGKTFDGQNIYKYNYKGDDTTRMGLSAQEVEKHNPSAVHKDDKGMRYLNYDDATKHAADKGHFARGGVADSMGGAVHEGLGRANYALRGGVEASYFNEVPYAYQPSGGSQTPLTMADIMPLLNVQKVRTGWTTEPRASTIKDDSPDLTSIIKAATTTPGQRANIQSAFGGLFSPYSPTSADITAKYSNWVPQSAADYNFASGGVVGRKGYAGDDGDSGGVGGYSNQLASMGNQINQTLQNLQAPPDQNKSRTLAEMIVGHPLSDEANLGVMAAGLGMLGSKSTNPFVAIGEGAQEGLGTYYNATKSLRDYQTKLQEDALHAYADANTAAYQQGELGLRGQQLSQEQIKNGFELLNKLEEKYVPQRDGSYINRQTGLPVSRSEFTSLFENSAAMLKLPSGLSSVVVGGTPPAHAKGGRVGLALGGTDQSGLAAADTSMPEPDAIQQKSDLTKLISSTLGAGEGDVETSMPKIQVAEIKGKPQKSPAFPDIAPDGTPEYYNSIADDAQAEYNFLSKFGASREKEAQQALEQVAANRKIADEIANGQRATKLIDPDTGKPAGIAPSPTAVAAAQKRAAEAEVLKTSVPDMNKMDDDLASKAETRPQARARINDAAEILSAWQSGKLSDIKAKLPAYADALGLNVDKYKLDSDSPNYETFAKDSAQAMFDRVKELGGRLLATAITGEKQANMNPDLQPKTNRNIIGFAKGAMDYEDQFYQDYNDWRATDGKLATKAQYNQFLQNWQKDPEHDFGKFVDNGRANTPVMGDLPESGLRRSGYQYVIPNDQLGGDMKKQFPNGVIATWKGNGWDKNSLKGFTPQ